MNGMIILSHKQKISGCTKTIRIATLACYRGFWASAVSKNPHLCTAFYLLHRDRPTSKDSPNLNAICSANFAL